ncbi:MAG: hypothetical protein MRY78_14395 [Saprospiraceae bacterium]|nr:hypothetical protein [Saprospiraceae bacterium]
MKIGVVGFSRNQFDQKAARAKLKMHLETILSTHLASELELVSGYTNMGVPRIAYQLADELGMATTGFSAKQALRVRAGLYPVDKKIIIGERFGDESEAFVAYIDVLIRIGGGPQSRHEVSLFRQRYADQNLDDILMEEEVDLYGK